MSIAKGRNAKLVKIHNRSLVLRTIQQKGKISRKNIAKIIGLTPATVTKITEYLLNEGLIIEKGSDSNSTAFGRKPIYLSINKDRYKIISFNIGRYSLRSAVFNLAGDLICKIEYNKKIEYERNDVVIGEIIGCIKDLLHMYNVDINNVLGIGISAPGPVNAREGIMLGLGKKGRLNINSHLLAPFDWRGIPLKKKIQDEFGIEVFADNDANVSALAESWFGSGIGISNFVLYCIGVGIGAGIIIDGMLYRGEDDVVSEIGHITVDLNGPQCQCGNVGCLELYASFSDILEEYRERKKKNKTYNAHEEIKYDSFISEIEDFFKAAYTGDTEALTLIKKKAEILGIGGVSLANIFSPELIIVSPSDLGDVDLSVIIDELQKSIKSRAFSVIADKVKIVQSKLGKDISLYGGVALVLQDFFQMLPVRRFNKLASNYI